MFLVRTRTSKNYITNTNRMNRVFVHLWNGPRVATEFIGFLGVGESFTDITSRFEVTVISIDSQRAVKLFRRQKHTTEPLCRYLRHILSAVMRQVW